MCKLFDLATGWTMMEISAELLSDAGWSEGEPGPISVDVEGIRSQGFVLSHHNADMLRSLAGIVLEVPARGVLPADRVRFDPDAACAEIDGVWRERYRSIVGDDLVPIGYAKSDHMMLHLAGDGRVIGTFVCLCDW